MASQTGFEADAIVRLKQAGYRTTLPRVQVLRVLALSDKPMSAYKIHQEIVAHGARVDVVSVYRTIEILSKLHLVHHVGIADGYTPCRLDDCHETDSQHVVCGECGIVTELAMPPQIPMIAGSQLHELGYKLGHTRVEILATCRDCLDSGKLRQD